MTGSVECAVANVTDIKQKGQVYTESSFRVSRKWHNQYLGLVDGKCTVKKYYKHINNKHKVRVLLNWHILEDRSRGIL